MSKQFLRPDRLAYSERVLWIGTNLVALGLCMIALGGFLCFPWPFFIIGTIVLWCKMRSRRFRIAPPSGIHGTARFASSRDLAAAGMTGNEEGLMLGSVTTTSSPIEKHPAGLIPFRWRRHPSEIRVMCEEAVFKKGRRQRRVLANLVRLPCSDAYSHVGCYLHTGAGKTWGIVIPNLLTNPENAVVYDPSGETVRETAEHRRRMGHDVRIIDPFGVSGVRETDRFNILDLIGPTDPGCFDYARHLAHALVIEKPESKQDPFWHSGTVSATEFLLHGLLLQESEEYRSLISLGEVLVAERFQDIAKTYSNHRDTALRRRAQQMGNFRGKTLDSLLACLTSEHAWMDSPAFADALSGSTFSVRSLFERKMTLYIVIPGHRALESQPFVRTLLSAVLFAGFEKGADIHRPPVRMYLDEAATLGRLELLNALYTQGRKFGLRSINFFQSIGQVMEIMGTPEKVQTFRGNMAAELFKAKDLETAKQVSEWIGQTTVHATSMSWQDGTNGGWSNSQGTQPSVSNSGGWSESTSRTFNETGVALIRPEEILQLRQREAILVSAGMPPVKLNILGAADVEKCRNGNVQNADERDYLRRVRWEAAKRLLIAGPLSLVFGFALVVTGLDEWSRQSMPVHVQHYPTSEPIQQPASGTEMNTSASIDPFQHSR